MQSFLIKSMLLVLLYIPAQFLFHKFASDTSEAAPFMKKIIEGKGKHVDADIITFGSSVEYMSHPAEKDKSTMTENLRRYLPEMEIIAFSQPAFNLKLLEALIKFYNRHVKTDQVYVIEINMDQFSVTDNKRFLDRTPQRLSYAENLLTAFYKPLSIFNYDFGVLTNKEFDAQEIYLKGEYQGKFDELYNNNTITLKELSRNRYMVKYLYELDKDHDNIRALESLAEYIRENRINALFYMVPFDYISCEKYFDKSTCNEILGNNIKIIKDILDKSEMAYLDLTLDLSTEHIATTPFSPNGHLKASGRKYNAQQISAWVKKNLK